MFGAKRPYKCHACNGAITKPPEEDEHVCKPSYIKRKSKNSKSDKEPYKCEQCDKSYSRKIAIMNPKTFLKYSTLKIGGVLHFLVRLAESVKLTGHEIKLTIMKHFYIAFDLSWSKNDLF